MRLITVSKLFPDLGNSKMATMPNLCNILENSNQWPTWIRRWIEFIGGSRITHWRGCQPCWAGTNIRFCQIFLTTAWNWENFGPWGGGVGALLDPLMEFPEKNKKNTYLQDVSTLVLLEYLHSNCCHTSSATRSCYRHRKGKRDWHFKFT